MFTAILRVHLYHVHVHLRRVCPLLELSAHWTLSLPLIKGP
jgi:hypothetical protein